MEAAVKEVSMTVMGVTGPTGAGKTTLLQEVERLGGGVIDCDAVYHEMLERDTTLQDRLEKEFGPCGTGQTGLTGRRLGIHRLFSSGAAGRPSMRSLGGGDGPG